MLKPGILNRRLVGEVISRIERKGLRIVALGMRQLDTATCERHYGEHKGKDFYEPLIEYMTSGPVITMILAGEEAISRLRTLCGPTRVEEASPGTIRGDFAALTRKNIVHASDSPESAEREIGIFFPDAGTIEWEDTNGAWYV